MTNNPPRHVIALIRVSTDTQAEEDKAGIPAQKTACKQIAERDGLSINWTVQIEGVSGAAVMYSPGIRELQTIVQSGQCHGIVMKEHTRLLRPDNFADYALLELLKEYQVKLYTVDGVLDLCTNTGQFMATVQFGMAGYERRVIRERTTSAKEELRRAGKCASAKHTLPFGVGYDRQKQQYFWYQDEIERVVRLFDLFTVGETTFSHLARKTGISYYSVRHILSNPIYTGWRLYDQRRDPSTKRVDREGKYTDARKVKRDEPIRVRVFPKGIISEDLFARAQELLRLKTEMRWRRNTNRPDRFNYRGRLLCAECDARLLSLTHNNGKSQRDYYVCRSTHGDRGKWDAEKQAYAWRIKNNSCRCRRMRLEQLEPKLDEFIGKHLSDPNFLLNLMRDHERALNLRDNQTRIERLTKEISDTGERKRRLKVLFIKGDLDEVEYETAKSQIATQIAAAQQTLAALKPVIPRVSKELLAELVAPFSEWDILKREDRRILLAAVAPVFKVAGYGNGGHGAGAKTEIVIKGVYLNLTRGHAQKTRAGVAQSSGSGNGRDGLVVDVEDRSPTARSFLLHSLLRPGSLASTRSSAKWWRARISQRRS